MEGGKSVCFGMSHDTYKKEVIRGTYYPHIDGIRTLAVLAVVFYHLEHAFCPGGFCGVDVFFVISGYLIGGGILRDLRAGTFSLASFYTRRIKRIMPAYFGMISVSLVVGMFLFHYEPLKSLGNAALRSSYFFTNFFCYKFLGDYFAGTAEEHPLLNLWSLSVEEQFYMVAPLALLLLWKASRRLVLPIILICSLASLVYAEFLVTSETSRLHVKAFYLLFPRAWELLAGVMLAMAPQACMGKKQALAAWLGLVLILFSYIFLGNAGVFPGCDAAYSIVGAALLVRYGNNGYIGRILESSPFVGIGKISYSLYLWHWPVIVYMIYLCPDGVTASGKIISLLLSFLLAYVSWRWLEMPVRRNKNITAKWAFGGLALSCLVVGAIGGLLFKTNGLVHYIHTEANRYASLEFPRSLKSVDPDTCGVTQLDVRDEKGKLQKGVVKHLGKTDLAPSYVLIGDSHAEAAQIGLDDISFARGLAGVAIVAKTCPLSGIAITNTFSNITEPFIAWLEQNPQLRRVILVCRWSSRVDGHCGQILYREGEEIPPTGKNNAMLLREGLLATCRRLTEMGREVVLLGPVPELKAEAGKLLRRRIILGMGSDNLGDAITEDEYNEANAGIFSILRECEQAGWARLVPVHEALLREGHYSGVVDGKLMYHDATHLSGEGSRYVIGHIFDAIFPKE